MIDTHSHIFSEEFDSDRAEVVARAKAAGVEKIILPNIDLASIEPMKKLVASDSDYFIPAMGLHPEGVKEDFENVLSIIKKELDSGIYSAVGEIGIDLYWDKTYYKQQVKAFTQQVEWALELDLPIIIHVRDSHKETVEALKPYKGKGLRGVFHCFTTSKTEADEIFQLGDFKLGIGGVVTFKNAGLAERLQEIPLEKLVLETDSPYLTPAPFRGKRNEPTYVQYVRDKLAEVYHLTPQEIDKITTQTAKELFNIRN